MDARVALDAAAAAAQDAENKASRVPVPNVAANVPAGKLPPTPAVAVDREKTCPLLMRVFPKIGRHHSLSDYAMRGKEPDGEIQIYTWKDASLRELTELIKEVVPEARRRDARINFAFVYPNIRGLNVLKQVGRTHSHRSGADDDKTLAELEFQTGDFLDVAILM